MNAVNVPERFDDIMATVARVHADTVLNPQAKNLLLVSLLLELESLVASFTGLDTSVDTDAHAILRAMVLLKMDATTGLEALLELRNWK